MAEPDKPTPIPDAETEPYWDAAREHVLRLPRCVDCATYVFPPRPGCPRCHGSRLEWVKLSGRGVVHSYAVMHETYMKGFDAPYVVALVELEEQPGLRLTTNIVGCQADDVTIGMPVAVEFEDRGGVSLPQFGPAREAG